MNVDYRFVHKKILPKLKYIQDAEHFDPRGLNVATFENAVVVPGSKENGGGLFADGAIVMFSDFAGRGQQSFDGDFEESDEDVVYLGQMFPTWGHCITDFRATAWPLVVAPEQYRDKKFVFVTSNAGVKMPKSFYALYEIIGLKQGRLEQVTTARRYRKVHFPEFSFWRSAPYLRSYTRAFKAVCDRIRDGIDVFGSHKDVIYLSRTAWQKFRWGRADFGEVVEKAFVESMGCEVVYPEELEFDEQISVVKHAKTIITADGSIAHNVFAQDGVKLVIVRKSSFINVHQPALNVMRDADVTYVDVYGFDLKLDENAPYLGPFLIYVNRNLRNFLRKKRGGLSAEKFLSVFDMFLCWESSQDCFAYQKGAA